MPLKTLKDIELHPKKKDTSDMLKELIKEEAIKWVKEFRNNIHEIGEYEFKEFLNLSEEDLK